MKCPYCSYEESKVIDSRPANDFVQIRRRRECLSCGQRFTTYEVIESTPIMIIKKDNTRQVFDRQKIMQGLIRACIKRPVSMEQMEHLVDEIQAKIHGSGDCEVPSVIVGDMVLEKLKTLDQVAYVRFASVYRDFKDVTSFVEELERLNK